MPDTKKILKNIPSNPGIYKMIDKEGRVLYVGKAKNLKKRVSSYFQKTDKGIRIGKMIEQINDINVITVDSELEAILLETNLIKELRPKYNILMRDDKNFVYIKLNQDDDFPTLSIVRKIERDGSKYFGPKTSKWKVEQSFDLLHKIFPFRNCKLQINWNPTNDGETEYNVIISNKVIKYPCLEYHIKRCSAPCIGIVKPEEYKKMIDGIVDFLNGKFETVLDQIKEKMKEAVLEKKFETAAKLRDQMLSVQDIMEKQKISSPDNINQDLISFVIKDNKIFFNLFMVRDGKLINQENFIFDTHDPLSSQFSVLSSNIYESFIEQYYTEASDIPKEILISENLEEQEMIENFLTQLKGSKVSITVPQKGKKEKLLELSQKNAENFAKQHISKFEQEHERTVDACKDLKEILNTNGLEIKTDLRRIECYDISHLSGTNTVASMVVFENGKAKNSDYRHFNVKNLEKGNIDDFKSMEGILERRLKYLSGQWSVVGGQYKIRKARKKDFEQIKKLRKKYKSKEEIALEKFYVLEQNAKIIGCVALLERDKNHFEITSLIIDSKLKNKNLTNALIQRVIEDCPLPTSYIRIKTEEKEFYINLGFEELQTAPSVIPVPHQSAGLTPAETLVLIHNRNKNLKDKDPSFTSRPDLIVIDGGKGQLSSALIARNSLNLDIPMIGLAKEDEEIVFCHSRENGNPVDKTSFASGKLDSENYKSILLPKSSNALQLLQRIRDEAHRFAITFNRNKREKALTHSVLDEISGIGPELKKELLKKFGSIEGIKKADFRDLREILGEEKAVLVQNYLLNIGII